MGYIQLYTGNGKGKTTAAFGLAIRASFAGKKIFIGQFVKSMSYHETHIGEICKNIKIEQFGYGCCINRSPGIKDKENALKGWGKCKDILARGTYDIIILDELTIAIYLGLLNEKDVITTLLGRNLHTEVIITGRYATRELINIADLVTDMQEIKHYYTKGVEARDGIER